MQQIESKWTNSVNFNLLNLGALTFSLVAYILFSDGKIEPALFSTSMAIVFLLSVGFLTARRNLKFAYNEEGLQLQAFPYMVAKSWRWQEIKSVDINDECRDESSKKTGEALYMFDTYGNRVLLAHRNGERTELRQVAAEFRRRIS